MRRQTRRRDGQRNQTVEWVGSTERYGRQRMPLPRSLANTRREIAEEKWEEARNCSERRIKKKYRMPGKMRQNAAGAGDRSD